jgi:small subunit ribosomal protein S6
MQQYELAVVYDPGLEVDLSKAEDRVKKIVADNGGAITATDNWGKRKLAYPINKNEHGVYVFYTVDLVPTSLGKIESTLNITNEVIRYLIVRQDEKELAKAEAAKAAKVERETKQETTDEAKEE